jgi:hypothetical protein
MNATRICRFVVSHTEPVRRSTRGPANEVHAKKSASVAAATNTGTLAGGNAPSPSRASSRSDSTAIARATGTGASARPIAVRARRSALASACSRGGTKRSTKRVSRSAAGRIGFGSRTCTDSLRPRVGAA